jgi:sugar lactone lactonase YvrE
MAMKKAMLGLTLGLCAGLMSAMASAPSDVLLPDARVFPESLSSGPDGTLYVGSTAKGVIYRAAPGAKTASLWITKEQGKTQGVFGVLADAASNTLWACSTGFAPPGAPPVETALKAFDLKTGALKGSYAFPSPGFCNDIAIAKDGSAYVSDTNGARVLRLKKGASALDVWSADPQLAGADGIAFMGDGSLIVTSIRSNLLIHFAVGADGAAGAAKPLATSRPLSAPDGFRAIGPSTFLLIDKDTLSKVTVTGDKAQVDNIKTGLETATAVALVKDTAYVTLGKLNYMFDPKLKDQDPGQFSVVAVPFSGN